MSNSEDYLDGLLNSISQKKSNVEDAIDKDEKDIQAKIADMSSLDPNDNFMDATGISDFKPRKMTHDNLRQAFSESDFLRDFEDELSSGYADDFIEEFEREIEEEEAMFERGEEPPEDSGSEFVRSLMEDDYEDEDYADASSNDESGDVTADSDDVTTSDDDVSIEDSFVTIDDTYLDEGESPKESDEVSDDTSDDTSDATADDEITLEMGGELSEGADADESLSAEGAEDGDDSTADDAAELLSALNEGADDADSGDDDSANPDDEEASSEQAKAELNEDIANNDDIQDILSQVENIVGDDTDNGSDEGSDDEEKSEESILPEEFQGDEHDDIDALEINEDGISLVDENADLDSLLQGEDSDIGDLLDADANDIELDESRDAFEASADIAENGVAENDNAEGEKKVGFFQKLLSIFKKKPKEDPEAAANELLNVASGGEAVDMDAENQKILEEMDEEEAEALAKKQAKAEAKAEKKAAKKAAKEEKAAKKAAEKEAKPKKEKKPGALKTMLSDDKSKKVPMKVIIIFVLLVATIVAVYIILTNVYNHKSVIKSVNASYAAGNYIDAYNELAGLSNLTDGEKETLNKARLLADLQNKKNEYDTFMKNKDYQNALDALIVAVGRYNENLEQAKELGVNAEYNGIESMIVGQLKDQFGMTDEEATQLYAIKGRTKYTVAVNERLKSLGMYKNDSNN